jgi:hypothetical protein
MVSTPVSPAPVTRPVDSLPRLPSAATHHVQRQGSGAAGVTGHMLCWSWQTVKAAASAVLGSMWLMGHHVTGLARLAVQEQARYMGPIMLDV